jgi:nicotinamidase-related amidase
VKTALLIVDIQNDYFPGGKMELEGSVAASEKAKTLLNGFRAHKLPTIHIQHVSVQPGATFFLPDTPGVEIHENVAPLQLEIVFQKNFPNSFRQTPLFDHLKQNNIEQLVIAGMMTHMCIDATTRAAFDYGFRCRLAHDACATKALTFGGKLVPAEFVHHSFVSALHGIYANALTADELLANL